MIREASLRPYEWSRPGSFPNGRLILGNCRCYGTVVSAPARTRELSRFTAADIINWYQVSGGTASGFRKRPVTYMYTNGVGLVLSAAPAVDGSSDSSRSATPPTTSLLVRPTKSAANQCP
ncbi:hypothetical protein N0V85_006616 [Neurospora sp. IMI 360204]|nr:hypothetical protein N0V85_006616 [Neurospora sp. IMI 360204]